MTAQPKGDACRQPGCKGTVEDGYCNVCGLATAKAAVPSARASAAVSTATGSSPVARGAKGSRRSSRSSSRSTRRNLGAGLISVPELPSTEPEKAILAEPKVPDNKRFCAKCDRPLSREKGFCGQCGQKYSFIPTLHPGDTVGGQYEVKGAIAYGGLGWIYLAFDRVLSRYVVLKGLLNTEDSAAASVALAERQFLAAVKHPNVVGIYNFVQQGAEGFIVMEYVGGKTLRDIRRTRGPLPPAEAIAYIHRILEAFGYLHELKLVYCDFKPENVMLEGGDVKLIDLGGVRRIDDPKGDIYGTEGYSAPEAGEGPTVASDLFTVGRTLAVLLTELRGFTKEHKYTLPHAQDDPVFVRQESLFRFLLKSTAENPDDRFTSADEMAGQLLGVLREVVSVDTGSPHPGNSTLFGGDMLALVPQAGYEPVRPDYRHLPVPSLDAMDPAANLVLAAAGNPDPMQRVEALRQGVDLRPKSVEARLRLANAFIDAHDFPAADKRLRRSKQLMHGSGAHVGIAAACIWRRVRRPKPSTRSIRSISICRENWRRNPASPWQPNRRAIWRSQTACTIWWRGPIRDTPPRASDWAVASQRAAIGKDRLRRSNVFRALQACTPVRAWRQRARCWARVGLRRARMN